MNSSRGGTGQVPPRPEKFIFVPDKSQIPSSPNPSDQSPLACLIRPQTHFSVASPCHGRLPAAPSLDNLHSLSLVSSLGVHNVLSGERRPPPKSSLCYESCRRKHGKMRSPSLPTKKSWKPLPLRRPSESSVQSTRPKAKIWTASMCPQASNVVTRLDKPVLRIISRSQRQSNKQRKE